MYSLYLNCASVIAEVLNVGLTAISWNAIEDGIYPCPSELSPFRAGVSSCQSESAPPKSWNLHPSVAVSPSKSRQAAPSIIVASNGHASAING